MTRYIEIPEALDFIAGQSWLAPDEPARTVLRKQGSSTGPAPPRLSWHEALRQITAIVRRIDLG